ncbi:MAG: N-formylglutamate deformylase [Pseudomonadota bacterium]
MTGIAVHEGTTPLILGLPHTGVDLPPEIAAALNDTGRALADTDWWIDRLYEGLAPGASRVRTPIHRYAIDVNRPPGGESLYPGQSTTSLVPMTDFEGRPIWRTPPDAVEIARRRAAFHTPYHAALAAEVARVKARHGHAVLYDCHSIRSRLPYLFEGQLPDFNIGTDGGRTAHPALTETVTQIVAEAGAEGYTHTVNGRFRGGWTTRHYGQPEAGVHAVQMELAQSTYLDEHPPWPWNAARAERLRPILSRILTTLAAWSPE